MDKISNHFSRREFACKCKCGFDTVDAELISILEDVREHFGLPVRINSACRCKLHNNNVGGTKSSQHLTGKAADITVDDTPSDDVYNYLALAYPERYGIGRYNSFTHTDSRKNKARW